MKYVTLVLGLVALGTIGAGYLYITNETNETDELQRNTVEQQIGLGNGDTAGDNTPIVDDIHEDADDTDEGREDADTDEAPADFVVYKYNAEWGPCPPEAERCSEETEVWSSGRFTHNDTQGMISEQGIRDIIATIRTTGVLEKNCSGDPVLDAYSKFTLSDGTVTKTIEWPACDELDTIRDEVRSHL